MSDRINALVVVLEEDLHEDNIQELEAAILQFRWVTAVRRNVVSIEAFIAQQRAVHDIHKRLLDVIKEARREAT